MIMTLVHMYLTRNLGTILRHPLTQIDPSTVSKKLLQCTSWPFYRLQSCMYSIQATEYISQSTSCYINLMNFNAIMLISMHLWFMNEPMISLYMAGLSTIIYQVLGKYTCM